MALRALERSRVMTATPFGWIVPLTKLSLPEAMTDNVRNGVVRLEEVVQKIKLQRLILVLAVQFPGEWEPRQVKSVGDRKIEEDRFSFSS